MTATTAHDSYLQGKELYDHNTREDNDASVALFKKAVELDPNYAQAYVGLTLAYNRQRAHGVALGSSWRAYRLAMRDPLLQNLHHDQQFQQLMAVAKAKVEEARQRAKDA